MRGGKDAYRIGPHTSYQTALQIPFFRTTERYRAAQGKNDYTYLAHDLPALRAKFQFILLLNLVSFSNLFFFLLRRAAAVLAQPGQKMLGHGGSVGKQEGAVPEHGVAVPACPAVIGDAQGEHVPRFYVPSLPPQEQTRLPWGRRTACRGCP